MRSLDSRLGITMDMPAQEDGEIFEATVFLDYFKDLPDGRQPGKVIYPLDEVLLLALLATLAGAEAFTDIARFGEKKLLLLRRFRPFRDGTPPRDRIGDIFATLDAEQFQRCFVAWVASVTGIPAGVIAIDGKTVRRSGRKRDNQAPIHMVSAFAARQRLVLGQVKVTDKSNEIIASNRGKSVGSRSFFPCLDSRRWTLYVMCRRHRPFPL